jgi:predicted glutamine amidotransferase
MCDLLGMCFNLPVQPNFAFKNFRYKDKGILNDNTGGWGIAFYPDQSAQIIKEEGNASSSSMAEKLVDYEYVTSKIIIAHVRAPSRGEVSHRNTHPFNRELNGKEWTFAHNGTLDTDLLKPLIADSPFQPIGTTDSEHAFCLLLKYIKDKKITAWNKENFQWLEEKLRSISTLKHNVPGTFNCIFSDGEYLFCYAAYPGNRLAYVRREAPFADMVLLDENAEEVKAM